jgi:hypothetical protein
VIRIRTGNRWKSERRLRGASLAEEAWDALGIEVDGIDISRGLLEGRLVVTLASLLDAVDALATGRRRSAQVGFPSGVVLLLTRRGTSILLSLVRLVRPSRVLFQDVEVDLGEFSSAAAESARDFLASLASRYPRASEHPLVRELSERASALLEMAFDGSPVTDEEVEASHLRRQPARGESPTLGFDLQDERGRIAGYREGDGLAPLLVRGHLYLHGPDGEELAAVEAIPFLALRDLLTLAPRLVAPDEGESAIELPLGDSDTVLEVDLLGKAVTVRGRTLRLEPRDLARSVFTCALDFTAVLAARNARMAANPYLADLREEARAMLRLLDDREAEAEAAPAPEPSPPRKARALGRPPAAGDLRKVSLRVRWRAEVEAVRRVEASGDRAWITHAGGVTSLGLADGSRRDHGFGVAVALPDRSGPAIVLEEGGILVGIGRQGPILWQHDTGFAELESPYRRWRNDAWVLVDRSSLVCLDLRTGAQLFRLDPPAAHRSVLASAGPFLALASDNGMLYAVDLERREVAWRTSLPLGSIAIGPRGIVGIAEGRRGLEAVGLAADRDILFREALPVDSVGQILPVRGGFVLAAAGDAGGELLGIGEDGALRFRARPVLGPGAPRMALAGRTIFARGSMGVCRVDRGRIRWSSPAGPGGAPRIVQGMVALPGESLSLRDATTGRELLAPSARGTLPASDHLVIDRDGGLLAVDIHGSCAGLQVAGALAVVAA